jgi:hypothetical protein
MIHPLAQDLSKLKDLEIESKIQELGRKYWQSKNPDVQQQISLFLDTYNEELRARRIKNIEQLAQNRDKDLDKLIKVN